MNTAKQNAPAGRILWPRCCVLREECNCERGTMRETQYVVKRPLFFHYAVDQVKGRRNGLSESIGR
jgi:hypothetical protein